MTVFTAAIMDMCHAGHLNLLREMRKAGDKIIVVLHDDKSCFLIKDKIPVQSIQQRIENLRITGLVDEIYVTKNIDPSDQFAIIISKEKDLLFMRADDNKNFPGKWLIDEKNIPIKYVKYTKGVSSTSLRQKLCSLF